MELRGGRACGIANQGPRQRRGGAGCQALLFSLGADGRFTTRCYKISKFLPTLTRCL